MSDMSFANTLNDANGSLLAGECHKHGSAYGCTPSCPVYRRNECELQALNTAIFITQGEIFPGEQPEAQQATDLTHIQSEQIAAWAIEAATSTPRTTIANLTDKLTKEKENETNPTQGK